MKYTVLFPECQNVHLIKRVGMIPYNLHKIYGWDASIACYKNEEHYSYLEKEVLGLKLNFIPKIFNNSRLDGLLYLLKNAKKIDVLQLFHIHSTRNYYWISLYKYLNPKGKVYLMLDTNYGLVEFNPFGRGFIKKIRMDILRKCSLISAETESTAWGLSDKWGMKVECVNNGSSYLGTDKVRFEEKENIICTVGRIGTYQKNSEILLKAYKLFEKEHPDWELRIIGPVEKEFHSYIEQFFHDNITLKEKIVFTGEIDDRVKLYNEYRKAKIFCLTSRWEGFAVSYIEALCAGCYIISSDVYSAFDITDYGRFGRTFSIGDYIGLYRCLCQICDNDNYFRRNCEEARDFVMENYDWAKNSMKIHDFIMN